MAEPDAFMLVAGCRGIVYLNLPASTPVSTRSNGLYHRNDNNSDCSTF